jgi:hypothetical protein
MKDERENVRRRRGLPVPCEYRYKVFVLDDDPDEMTCELNDISSEYGYEVMSVVFGIAVRGSADCMRWRAICRKRT